MHRRLGVKIAKFRQKRCETSLRQIALCLLFSLIYNLSFDFFRVSVCGCANQQNYNNFVLPHEF